MQAIAAIGEQAEHLTVFQRRPNWCAPLHNSEISPEEMSTIRARYDDIFDLCARTPGGFEHQPIRTGFHNVSAEERRAMWEKLYGEPGFGIWMANYREIFFDEEANAELSAFIADKIRERVDDPVIAEKLIPKDHGFGVQRVPLETNYYETYNRPNVSLVDLQETPIERITPTGIQTSDQHYEFDLIVYATGFDAMTGAFDRIDFRGSGGQRLADKWKDGPITFLGMMVNGFPNLLTIAGPQSGLSLHQLPAGHRDRRRVDHRPDGLRLGERLHPLRGRRRRRAGVDQPRHRDVQHDADAQGAGLVHRVQTRTSTVTKRARSVTSCTTAAPPKYKRRIDEVADGDYQEVAFSSERALAGTA